MGGRETISAEDLLKKETLMSVKLKTSANGTVHLSEMRDGQIAVITSWDQDSHVGNVVQRFREALIRIGYGWGTSWPHAFTPGVKGFSTAAFPQCRVKILSDGRELIVTDNQ